MDLLMTQEQLAQALRVSSSTIWALRKQGLPCMRVGKQLRFIWAEVAHWLHRPQDVAMSSTPQQLSGNNQALNTPQHKEHNDEHL